MGGEVRDHRLISSDLSCQCFVSVIGLGGRTMDGGPRGILAGRACLRFDCVVGWGLRNMGGRIQGVLGVDWLLVHWGWVAPPPWYGLPAGATTLVGPRHPVSGRSTTPSCLALFWLLTLTLPCGSTKALATLACLAHFELFDQGHLFNFFNQGDVETLDVDLFGDCLQWRETGC